MIKRIVLIGALHFVLSLFAILVQVNGLSEMIREGTAVAPSAVNISDNLLKVILEPMKILFFSYIPKDGLYFYFAIMINSILWGVVLSVMWKWIWARNGK